MSEAGESAGGRSLSAERRRRTVRRARAAVCVAAVLRLPVALSGAELPPLPAPTETAAQTEAPKVLYPAEYQGYFNDRITDFAVWLGARANNLFESPQSRRVTQNTRNQDEAVVFKRFTTYGSRHGRDPHVLEARGPHQFISGEEGIDPSQVVSVWLQGGEDTDAYYARFTTAGQGWDIAWRVGDKAGRLQTDRPIPLNDATGLRPILARLSEVY